MSTHPKPTKAEEQVMPSHDPIEANLRRTFFLKILAGSALIGAGATPARAAEKLSPTDAYARSMGYRLNTEEVDQAKYPRHTAEQSCQSCQLWNGGDKDLGNCSFFDGAITPKKGWCKNFKVKKATAS
jgi:hypothetical protein